MFSNKKPTTAKEIGSLIGVGSTLTGDIEFVGGLRIDGTVRGAVRCTEGEKGGMLVISEHGTVEGEVRAAHLVVSGRISGPVYASELVELQPKARVVGDLHYRALEMHHGAIVEGKLIHQPESGKAVAPLKLAATPARAAEAPESPRESAAG